MVFFKFYFNAANICIGFAPPKNKFGAKFKYYLIGEMPLDFDPMGKTKRALMEFVPHELNTKDGYEEIWT